MTLPDFLMVGAMKSGTTTLFRDLCQNQSIYIPEQKELNALLDDRIREEPQLSKYAALFKGALGGQIRGEASTTYTMMPTYQGVAERAHRIMGEDLKIIYMVREPVARALSQHRYLYKRYGNKKNRVPPDCNIAFRTNPAFVSYSLYAFQIAPWIEKFGRDSCHLIVLERYSKEREAVLKELFAFLDLPCQDVPPPPPRANVTSRLQGLPPVLQRFVETDFYLKAVRPIIGPITGLARGALTKERPNIDLPDLNASTVDWMKTEIRPDAEAFLNLLDDSDRAYAQNWEVFD